MSADNWMDGPPPGWVDPWEDDNDAAPAKDAPHLGPQWANGGEPAPARDPEVDREEPSRIEVLGADEMAKPLPSAQYPIKGFALSTGSVTVLAAASFGGKPSSCKTRLLRWPRVKRCGDSLLPMTCAAYMSILSKATSGRSTAISASGERAEWTSPNWRASGGSAWHFGNAREMRLCLLVPPSAIVGSACGPMRRT